MGDRPAGSDRRTTAGLWLGAGLCLSLAALLGSWLAPRVQRGLETYRWPAIAGVVLEAERDSETVRSVDDYSTSYFVSLRYAYSVPDGRGGTLDLSGDRYDLGTGSGSDEGRGIGSAGKVLDAARDAPAVTVRYDPDLPHESVVRPGVPYGTAWLFLPLAWLGGLGIGLARAAVSRREPKRPHPAAAVLGAAALFGFGAPVLLACATIVTERWLHAPPNAWWAIGLSVAGLPWIVAPGVIRLRAVRTVLGLTAPVFALTVLVGLALFIQELAGGEPLPKWEPSDEETVARLSHANARVREWACRRIGRARSPRPPADVVARLISDPDDDVAGAAMFLVKETGVHHPEIAARLTERLDDEDERVRQDAAWRLAGQRDADPDAAVGGAFALLRGGETSQRAGLTLLGQIGRGRDDAADAVAELVRDGAAPSRGQAIWTLELMRSDQAVALDAAFAVLAEGDEKLRRPAVHYLAEVGREVERMPAAALDALLLDLEHAEARRRQDAVRALARLGRAADAARPQLEAVAAADEDALTRELARKALAGDGTR